jgi:hypothetical protein
VSRSINGPRLRDASRLSRSMSLARCFGDSTLPKMMESAQRFHILPHLVIVASEVGFTCKTEFDKVKGYPFVKMNDQKTADMSQRYELDDCAVESIHSIATTQANSFWQIPTFQVHPIFSMSAISRP